MSVQNISQSSAGASSSKSLILPAVAAQQQQQQNGKSRAFATSSNSAQASPAGNPKAAGEPAPFAAVANRGSNQLSLETPRNNVGESIFTDRVSSMCRSSDEAIFFRIRNNYTGQGCQLGASRFNVAHDFRSCLLRC